MKDPVGTSEDMQEVPVEVPVVSVAGDQSDTTSEQNVTHHSPATTTSSLVNDYESPWRSHQVNVMRVLSSVVSQIVYKFFFFFLNFSIYFG